MVAESLATKTSGKDELGLEKVGAAIPSVSTHPAIASGQVLQRTEAALPGKESRHEPDPTHLPQHDAPHTTFPSEEGPGQVYRVGKKTARLQALLRPSCEFDEVRTFPVKGLW